MATEEVQYQPKDAISTTINAALIVGGAGLFTSAVSNSLARENVGPLGIITRTGSTITTFAASGALFGLGSSVSANLREKDDYVNDTVGGFFGGAASGLRFRTFGSVLGVGTFTAVVLGSYSFLGGSLRGFERSPDHDEFAEKMRLRANRRRPIQETIDELGEGRGVYGPGYQERRRERIKQNYGIEVPTSFPPPRPE